MGMADGGYELTIGLDNKKRHSRGFDELFTCVSGKEIWKNGPWWQRALFSFYFSFFF